MGPVAGQAKRGPINRKMASRLGRRLIDHTRLMDDNQVIYLWALSNVPIVGITVRNSLTLPDAG